MKNKKGQVWIETVIYMLIALAMIAAVLAFVRPKIAEIQDKAIIEQTKELLNVIDQEILSLVRGGVGNSRIVELGIQKGQLTIDGAENKIYFEIEESRYAASEPGVPVEQGNILIETEKMGDVNNIRLTLDYSENYEISYLSDENGIKTIGKASIPYKLKIKNTEFDGAKTHLAVELI